MEDIPLLVEHFLMAYDRKLRPQITAKVMDTLMNYPWPGNVRELQNVLYRFVTLKRLDLTGGNVPVQTAVDSAPNEQPALAPLADAVENLERRLITATLAECRWNRTRAARALGIGLRTLQRKMKAYGIR